MASYTKPDERLNEQDLVAIITAAVPSCAYRNGQREWIWTRPGGVWHLNLVFALDHGGPSLRARLDAEGGGSNIVTSVTVRTTRREINAALRWLVLVDAIDRHPDDAQAVTK